MRRKEVMTLPKRKMDSWATVLLAHERVGGGEIAVRVMEVTRMDSLPVVLWYIVPTGLTCAVCGECVRVRVRPG